MCLVDYFSGIKNIFLRIPYNNSFTTVFEFTR